MKRDKNIFRRAFFCLAIFFLNCITVYSFPPGIFEVTRVGLDKKSFDPTNGEKVDIGFETTEDADVNVAIYDVLGQKVKNFNVSAKKEQRCNIAWDGLNFEGNVPSGNVFLYTIEAQTKQGQNYLHNPAAKTGGIEVKPLEYTFDNKTGNIEYVLPKACMVRIRAGFKDGMFARSIFDWEPQTAGRHTYMWDGKDESGFMNLLRHPELDLRLTCYTLPDNTVIFNGKTIPLDNPQKGDRTNLSEREKTWATKGKYMHYMHDPRICHKPGFNISFLSAKKVDDSNNPIVSGVVPIRVELDGRDKEHLINTRFEVMLFIDGVYVYEIEEGSSPFTYNWDTSNFAKGPHIITINIVGYDDHIGIVSRKVVVGD